MCYAIKYAGKDFSFLENNENIKGTRKKRQVQDTSNQFAVFKYEQPDYCCSEACSEKLCYEIAVCLKYPCARIEVAKFENYILKSKTYIYKENSSQRYKHFELIEYLIELYPEEMKEEI